MSSMTDAEKEISRNIVQTVDRMNPKQRAFFFGYAQACADMYEDPESGKDETEQTKPAESCTGATT